MHARAFAAEARRHPELGGYWYAGKLDRYCRVYVQHRADLDLPVEDAPTAEWLADPPNHLRWQRAREDADRLCQGYGPGGDPDEVRWGREGRAAGDRLLLITADLVSGDTVRRRAGVQAALAFGDPAILMHDAPLMLPSDDRRGIWLADHWLPGSSWSQVVAAAWSAACELGHPCGSDLPLLRDNCLWQATCADSLDEFLRERLTPAQWAEVQRLRPAIVRAFREQDVSFFVPPGG